MSKPRIHLLKNCSFTLSYFYFISHEIKKIEKGEHQYQYCGMRKQGKSHVPVCVVMCANCHRTKLLTFFGQKHVKAFVNIVVCFSSMYKKFTIKTSLFMPFIPASLHIHIHLLFFLHPLIMHCSLSQHISSPSLGCL